MRTFFAFLVAANFLAVTAPAAGEDDIHAAQLTFPITTQGTKTRGRISGYEGALYRVGVAAGQRIKIALNASTNQTFFTVFGPGQEPGTGGLAGSNLTGPYVPDTNRFDGIMLTSGFYQILVYQMRNAARKGLKSNYTLTVSISDENNQAGQGAYGEELEGGPDVYEVATRGGRLNLRVTPSVSATIMTRLAPGTPLENGGCHMVGGQRWCRVATRNGLCGWAAGDFLIEGSGSVAVSPGSDSCSGANKRPEKRRRISIDEKGPE